MEQNPSIERRFVSIFERLRIEFVALYNYAFGFGTV